MLIISSSIIHKAADKHFHLNVYVLEQKQTSIFCGLSSQLCSASIGQRKGQWQTRYRATGAHWFRWEQNEAQVV